MTNKYESLPCSTRQSLALQLNGFSGQDRNDTFELIGKPLFLFFFRTSASLFQIFNFQVTDIFFKSAVICTLDGLPCIHDKGNKESSKINGDD